MVIEIRTAVDSRGAGLTKKKHKEYFRGDGNVLDLGNLDVFVKTHYFVYYSISVYFTMRKLFPNKGWEGDRPCTLLH